MSSQPFFNIKKAFDDYFQVYKDTEEFKTMVQKAISEAANKQVKEYRCADCFHEEKCQSHNRWNIKYGVEGCFYPKTQSDGDLISREAIKDLYNKMQNANCGDGYLDFNGTHYTSDMGYAFEGMEILIKEIDKLPSIQPKNGNSNDASYQHTIYELNKVVQEQAEKIRTLKETIKDFESAIELIGRKLNTQRGDSK